MCMTHPPLPYTLWTLLWTSFSGEARPGLIPSCPSHPQPLCPRGTIVGTAAFGCQILVRRMGSFQAHVFISVSAQCACPRVCVRADSHGSCVAGCGLWGPECMLTFEKQRGGYLCICVHLLSCHMYLWLQKCACASNFKGGSRS